MVKFYGYITLDGDKWWIRKWDAHYFASLTSEDYPVTIYLINMRTKQKKQITVYSHDLMWGLVEKLQKEYPTAMLWKTKKERIGGRDIY